MPRGKALKGPRDFSDEDPPCERCGNAVSSIDVALCKRCHCAVMTEERYTYKPARRPPMIVTPKPKPKPRKKPPLWTHIRKPRVTGPWLCPACGPVVGAPFHGDDDQFHCPNGGCDEVVGLAPG